MSSFWKSSPFVRSVARAAVVTAALVLPVGSPASAQHSEETSAKLNREPVVFTIDVAEDLAGKFVPTFVKPEHTQPGARIVFRHRGTHLSGRHHRGRRRQLRSRQERHIGVWFCRGTHLVAASEIPAAPLWVDTAQLFVLGWQGREQLATEGVEGGGTVTRIVTGGAGNYAGFIGEQRQTFLGFNATGGVNLRVTFILRKSA